MPRSRDRPNAACCWSCTRCGTGATNAIRMANESCRMPGGDWMGNGALQDRSTVVDAASRRAARGAVLAPSSPCWVRAAATARTAAGPTLSDDGTPPKRMSVLSSPDALQQFGSAGSSCIKLRGDHPGHPSADREIGSHDTSNSAARGSRWARVTPLAHKKSPPWPQSPGDWPPLEVAAIVCMCAGGLGRRQHRQTARPVRRRRRRVSRQQHGRGTHLRREAAPAVVASACVRSCFAPFYWRSAPPVLIPEPINDQVQLSAHTPVNKSTTSR